MQLVEVGAEILSEVQVFLHGYTMKSLRIQMG